MLNFTEIKNVGTRVVGRSLLLTKKYSPEILTAVGIVSGVAAAVMGAKATLKLESVVDEHDVRKEIVYESTGDHNSVSYKRDIVGVYTHTTLKITKLYGPAVSLGVGSIACVIGAHGIMRRRNVALIAAYKAIETSFSQYRQRVEDQYGEQKALDLKRGISKVDIEDENGKKKTVDTFNVKGLSQYARFFDPLSKNFSKDHPEYNLVFLKTQQNFANDILHSRGHIFLNDVYDMLDIPRTPGGQLVGWVRGEGDNFVDFGIYDITNEKAREFVNGYETAILLDFNVNGIVYDLI